jgi:hypothetical protein
MALRFVLDEHFLGPLWRAIQHHNAGGAYPIDATRVGDPSDLPRGTPDPDLLIWAEREGRIIVTDDRNTLITFLAQHLQAGRHSPGVILVRPGFSLGQLLFELALIAHAGDPVYYADCHRFIP